MLYNLVSYYYHVVKHTWVIIFSISDVFISGSVLLRNSTIFSKLSHSIISVSWLLSRLSATLNMTSVPWRKIISKKRDNFHNQNYATTIVNSMLLVLIVKCVFFIVVIVLNYCSKTTKYFAKEKWSKSPRFKNKKFFNIKDLKNNNK